MPSSYDFLEEEPVTRPKRFQNFDPYLTISIIVFILFSLVLVWLNRLTDTSWHDFVTEMNGMFLDLFMFGILLAWLDRKWRRSEKARGYLEHLEDFRFWRSEEGVWRKVGLIRRLLDMGQTLPSMEGIELETAILPETHLNGTNLKHANLGRTFFLGSHFKNVSLQRANLEKAYLEKMTMQDVDCSFVYGKLIDLRKAQLNDLNLVCANLEGSLFNEARLDTVDFEGCNLTMVNFHQAVIDHGNFHATRCKGTDFHETALNRVDFRGADLSGSINLTREQIRTCCINEETQLPPDLNEIRSQLETISETDFGPVRSQYPDGVPRYRAKPDEDEGFGSRRLHYS